MSDPNQAIQLADTNGNSMLALIDRAARDPNVDIGKMERLLAMAESIHAREAKAQYDTAMNAAQGEMRPISRDCSNPQTRSRYASYEAIDSAIRPVYTSHGFAMSFGSRAASAMDRVMVTCRVSHRGGHTEYMELEMPADGKGPKGNDLLSKTHATGSAISYAKRYIANLVWNLSFGETDDDGNSAGRTAPVSTMVDMRNRQTNSAPKQCEVKPEKRLVATESTRTWMLTNLTQFNEDRVKAFAINRGILTEVQPLTEWPFENVPTSRPALNELVREIERFIAENQPQPDLPENSDFWNEIITVPRAGTKRADYMQHPDTIRSLYDAMKSGDEKARTRLFGIAREWEPQEWVGNGGQMMPPSEADIKCRAALDAFLKWEEKGTK